MDEKRKYVVAFGQFLQRNLMKKWILVAFCLLIPMQMYSQFVEKPRKNKYKYFLSIATQFQQEGRFLKEWIEYHKLIGVDHFYLYNNNSTDDFLEVLEPYIESGEVDLIDWPSDPSRSWAMSQYCSVRRAIYDYQDETRWLAIMDVDEFLVPLEHYSLIDFLNEHEKYGQIVVMWRFFGTSGVEKIPEDQLMIETLLQREAFVPGKVNQSKSIVKPKAVQLGMVHISELKPGFETKYYNDGLEEFPPIIMHHYWTRDYDFLMNVKHERQQRLKHREWTEEEIDYYKNVYNDVVDETMLNYAMFIREAVLSD